MPELGRGRRPPTVPSVCGHRWRLGAPEWSRGPALEAPGRRRAPRGRRTSGGGQVAKGAGAASQGGSGGDRTRTACLLPWFLVRAARCETSSEVLALSSARD